MSGQAGTRRAISYAVAAVVVVVVGVTAFGAAGTAAADPTPIGDCRTIDTPGSYEISQDLAGVLQGGDVCLNVTASDVRIDGDGHTIVGQAPNTTEGIVATNESTVPLTNVTVANLTVERYYNDVRFIGVQDGRIANVTATDAERPILVQNGSHGTVVSNVRTEDANSTGIEVFDSDDVLIEHSVVQGQDSPQESEEGIVARQAANLTIAHSRIAYASQIDLAVNRTDLTLTNVSISAMPRVDGEVENALLDWSRDHDDPPNGRVVAGATIQQLYVDRLASDWIANLSVTYDPADINESSPATTLYRNPGNASWQQVAGATTDRPEDTVTANLSHNGYWYAVLGPDAVAPTAAAGSDVTTDVGSSVGFDAGGSTDDDGIASYEWDFGDGNSANGSSVFHTYDSAGTYTAELTVTDHAGNEDTDTRTVTVQSDGGDDGTDPDPDPSPPVADAGDDRTVALDPIGVAPVRLDASGSTDEGTIVEYEWDIENVDDGPTSLSVETGTVNLFGPGTFTATVTVTDDDGETGTDTVTITVVDDMPPVADAGEAVTIAAGETTQFDGSGSSDNDAIASYEWTVTDGSYSHTVRGSTPSLDPVHLEASDATVTLTVTDRAGNTATDTITAPIEPGVVAIDGDIRGPLNENVSNPRYRIPLESVSTDEYAWLVAYVDGDRIGTSYFAPGVRANPSLYSDYVAPTSGATNITFRLYRDADRTTGGFRPDADSEIIDPDTGVQVVDSGAYTRNFLGTETPEEEPNSTNTSNSTNGTDADGTPGFSAVAALLAIAIGVLARRRR